MFFKNLLAVVIFLLPIAVTKASELPFYIKIEEENVCPWQLYHLCCRYGEVEIRFPEEPILTANSRSLSLAANDSGHFPLSFYSLTIEVNDSTIDFEKKSAELLHLFSSPPLILLGYEVKQTETGIRLDIESAHSKTQVIRKDCILMDPQAICSLVTQYFSASLENHAFFVESFSIARKQ